ncbi:MAG: GNAT family N-acetyltransferase [Nitrospira sp.]|nr:GNAT family N-acetyltransferase [Nitrospira sp.]
MLYAGPARDQEELNLAIALAGRAFASLADGTGQNLERKRAHILEHPGAGKDPAIVVSLGRQGVIGAAFLIDRMFPRGPASIRGTFLSSVCIDESLRGQGYSRILIGAALQACSKRGAAIALVIARRAVDRFYNKFGFWGLSQYNKLTVESAVFADVNTAGLRLRRVSIDDIRVCSALYDLAYEDSFGHCSRDWQTWKYVMEESEYLRVTVSVIENDRAIIAYAIHDESGNIHEISSDGISSARMALALLARSAAGKLLTVYISPTHPAVRALEGFDVTLTTRECPFGGHMVKVVDPVQLVDAAVCRIEQLARSKNIAPGTEDVDGVRLMWDGEKASVHPQCSIESFASVARLLGVAHISSAGRPLIFDPSVSFNIPLVDQI